MNDIHFVSKDEMKNIIKQLININPSLYSLEDVKKCGIDKFAQDVAEEVVHEMLCDGDIVVDDGGKIRLAEDKE